MWNGWIIGILGIWMVIVPFLGFTPAGYAWNNWIVGVVTAIIGFALVDRRPWQGWVSGIVGVWLFISGFIGGLLYGFGVWWNSILIGIVFIIAGFAAVTRRMQRPPMQRPPA